MNLFTKRIGLLVAAVVGVGAIAALSIGASFSLFSATSPGTSTTFTAGTVSLGTPTAATCTTASNLEPGDTGTCTFNVTYSGSLPAYIGAEATANGVLAPELSFTINGTAQTDSTPVLIGNSVAGSTINPNGETFTADVDYTFASTADNSYQGQSAVVTVTFYAVQCSYNGSSNSTLKNDDCSQAGPLSWATAPGVLYNSRIDYSAYAASIAYEATGMNAIGSEISLANGGGTLSNVVVDMANFNPVAPTALGNELPITLSIYNPGTATTAGSVPGSLIATDTQTFIIPGGPNGGYGSPYCTTGAGASNPYCGIANFSITFNDWGSYAPVTLPGTVIYEISYNNTTVETGLNVQLSTEPTQVSVGSDTYPGTVFVSEGGPNQDVGPGEITCSTVTLGGAFAIYSTVPTPAGASCGLSPYIPGIEFNS
jgi:hypothetical protein